MDLAKLLDERSERFLPNDIKISKLETALSSARVIDESTLDLSKALILSKVKIRNIANASIMEYTLVSEKEADLKEKKISEDENKKFEKEIQIITDEEVKKIEEKVSQKEKEIMKV